MPLFRYSVPTSAGEDATYDFPTNPDPKRFEAVPEKAAKAAKRGAEPEPAKSTELAAKAEPENKE
jgi:hypothetical protein